MSAAPAVRPTNYLEQFDAAPDAAKYPLVRGWIDTEPLPFFKELREKRPVLVTLVCTLVRGRQWVLPHGAGHAGAGLLWTDW